MMGHHTRVQEEEATLLLVQTGTFPGHPFSPVFYQMSQQMKEVF